MTARSNAAFYYAPDGYETKGRDIMGRHAAGEGFLRGYARHAAVDALVCFARSRAFAEHFASQTQGLRPAGKKIRWVAHEHADRLADPGCLFFPGPNLEQVAWQRRHYSQRSYSLCGVTHTTATRAVMDALGSLLTAPVQSWDAVICTSRSVRNMVERVLDGHGEYLRERMGAGAKPVRQVQLPVIPLGVDCAAFAPSAEREKQRSEARAAFGIGPDDVAALFVGRLSHHGKANPMPMYVGLEEAAKRTGKRVHLIQCGWWANKGQETAYRQGAAFHSPSVNAIFADGRDEKARGDAWAAADLFTSLSDNVQETFGLTPIEAMAAGLPVVVTDWDGYRDTVRPGIDGFAVPTRMPGPGLGVDLALRYAMDIDSYDTYVAGASQFTVVDIAACTDAYAALIADAGLRARMGKAGRQRALAMYDWSVVVAAYQDLWAELAERRTRDAEIAPRRPGFPIAPLRDDPFALFGSYASARIVAGNKIEAMPAADDAALSALRKSPLAGVAQIFSASEEDCRQVLALLQDKGTLSVETTLAAFPPGRRPVVVRTLGWLAKHNLIRFVP